METSEQLAFPKAYVTISMRDIWRIKSRQRKLIRRSSNRSKLKKTVPTGMVAGGEGEMP